MRDMGHPLQGLAICLSANQFLENVERAKDLGQPDIGPEIGLY